MAKYSKVPKLSGKKLSRLLQRDGWKVHRRTRHGIALIKTIGAYTRTTIIQDTRADIPEGTLADILGQKQMGIGEKGLLKLINRYGI